MAEGLAPPAEKPRGFWLTTKLEEFVAWGRKNSLWPLPFGTACCAIEFMSLMTSRYDFSRFGAEAMRFSPRQSDLMLVLGTITNKQASVLRKIYSQMSDPKWVVCAGACASTGGIYRTYATLQGIDRAIPVDVYVPGCPPRPEAIIKAVVELQEKMMKEGFTSRDADLDAFVAVPLTEGYREMVAFFAGLMADGVMDPEITQDDDSALQKFINGRSAMVTTNFSQMEVARADALEEGIDLNVKMIAVPMGNLHQITASGGGFGPGFVLNANVADSPYFLATLQFIDWILFSEEGREFTVWGVEGVTFFTDEDGNRWYYGDTDGFGASALNPNFADINPDDLRRIDREYGFQDGVWIGTHNAGSVEMAVSLMAPELQAWVNNELATKALSPVAPAAPMTELETEEAGIIGAEINAWVFSQTAFFISGQRSMDEWPMFQAELEAMGINRLVEMRNDAVARARG
ncbi:MAG: NADH-quinone oxidoreductase subunit NuoB [Promicromonosporaceae bacterium]|nr:NADH-quinone oxidoreductase subunit NuoB [Promicromonosporaceae bacterium]